MRNEATKYIFELSDKGFFKEYSDEHFLIKALNGNLDYFRKYGHLIKDKGYYANDEINALNFLMNFSTKFEFFCNKFNNKQMHEFIINQLSAGKQNYSEEQFIRALSEIHVINFLMAFGPVLKEVFYEPPLGENGANPEVRLVYENDIIVDY